jgi:very-short-patch-repair endonuclease
MLAALTVIAARRGTPIEMKLPEDPLIAKVIKEDNYPGDQRRVVIYVKPQAQLGDYRVDFLLEYKAMVMANPPETEQEATQRMARQVEEIMTQGYATPDWVFKYVEVDLIIECDGHDFHEKTKHQAARDKQRDRLLQSIGYKVFRYTGSEIHRDAISCAEEVIDTLHSTARAIAVQKYKDSH